MSDNFDKIVSSALDIAEMLPALMETVPDPRVMALAMSVQSLLRHVGEHSSEDDDARIEERLATLEPLTTAYYTPA